MSRSRIPSKYSQFTETSSSPDETEGSALKSYRIRLTVNGQVHEEEVEARTLLVYFLRERLGLTGTHVGCDTTNCGACTILLDGRSVKSCTVLAVQADGCDILTIEGVAPRDQTNGRSELHPIQEAFWESHGLQCGYCTPGLIMETLWFLRENPHPTEEEIRRGISGNLCMCTGYVNIIRAVKSAAQKMEVK